MRNPQTVAAILVTVALLVIGAACGSDDPGPDSAGLSPLEPDQVAPAPQEAKAEPGDPSSRQVSSGSPIPRPKSIETLVAWSDIIVLGTISSVLDEKVIYYGKDGNPVPADEERGAPFTDYEVRIDSALKGDGDVEDGGVLVSRVPGSGVRRGGGLE